MDRQRAGLGRGSSSSRELLMAAVALQDHKARTLRMAGSGKHPSTTRPGANLTLAQRMGLVQRPPEALTHDQWEDVLSKFRERVKNSSEAAECSICLEPLYVGEQVLLNCTHSFHKACLQSFEAFAQARTCPVCRCQNYEKKRVEEARTNFLSRHATVIQAHWRGYLQRKRFRQQKRQLALQSIQNNNIRMKWGADKLSSVNDDLRRGVQDREDDLDRMFAELETSVAQAREATDAALRRAMARRLGPNQSLGALEDERRARDREREREREERMTRQRVEAGLEAAHRIAQGERPPFRTAVGQVNRSATTAAAANPSPAAGGGTSRSAVVGPPLALLQRAEAAVTRPAVLDRRGAAQTLIAAGVSSSSGLNLGVATAANALPSAATAQRSASNPSHLTRSQSAGDGGASSSGGAGGGGHEDSVAWDRVIGRALDRNERECSICLCPLAKKPRTAWLSCSHVYHADCLEAFELFEASRGAPCRCPMCRGHYCKKILEGDLFGG